MRGRAAWLAGLVWMATAGAVAAQPAVVAGQAFVSSGGFFPDTVARAVAGIDGADGVLSPAELGVLVLELREARTVWRARWVVRVTRRQIGADTVDLTEVERFNMGPATRAQYLRVRGTAPAPEVFGLGPHVAWRLVSRPDGPLRTVLLNVGRRDYPDYEVRERDCGGALCTSVETPMDKRAGWTLVREETSAAAPSPFPAIVARTNGQVDFEDESIAHVTRALSVLSGMARGSGAAWVGPAPGTTVTAVMDSNVGEDAGSDAMVGPVGAAAGGATAEGGGRWLRRTSAVGMASELTVRVFEGVLR